MRKYIITEEEKKRILSLHRFHGHTIMEQSASLKLADGHYFAQGSGNGYEIKDFSKNKTGYSVKANKTVRGPVINEPIVIVNGIPISTPDAFGKGGEVSFKDIGWAGSVEPLTPVITPNSLINNSIPEIIVVSDAPQVIIEGGKGEFIVGDKLYMLDLSSIYNKNYYGILGTETIDSLIETLNTDEQAKFDYPNSYNFLSSNAKLGTQYINLLPDLIFVNKKGTPEVFQMN